MSEWYTAVPSHNAGSTVVTVVSSLHLATYYGINVKSQAKPPSRAAPIVELSSQEQLQEMDIWHTRNASSKDGVHD